MSAYELQHIDYVVSKTIKNDIERAYNHTENHITTKGDVPKLDSNCEYCKVQFEEQRILNK